MQVRKFAAILLLVLSSFAASGVKPAKPELESMYDKAFRAFDSAQYDEALKALDTIDQRQPDLAESLNLRGVVYMRQGKYDKAEAALRKALSIEPRFWNASFNLAEIPFLKKEWKEARTRFEVLMAGETEGLQPETTQLIQYKVLLTFVLQGKENTVDWILNKFEADKESPALYYSNAAIAFHRGQEKEAKEWLSAASKQFSAPLNKLYAESFYEVGWMEKPAGESRAALEITSTAERAERLKADAKANFEKAERAFQQRDFESALKSLDLAEAGLPNDPAALNLRGEILMEQGKLEEAETAVRAAFTADPKFREAQYNLAQIPFKKGEYAKSRDRFEALFAETPGGEKNQAAQLIRYKIFMTFLLEGREPEAHQLMDQFKFTGDTPALYYAQAAWEYKHDRVRQGKDWVTSARKIYSPALNMVFADSFYDLGWLKKTGEEESPPTAALAQADATPATGPKPAMRFGLPDAVPAPDLIGEATPAGTVSASPAIAAATPASTAVAVASSSARPAATPVPKSAPVATPAAVSTTLASEQARRLAEPTLAERIENFSNPRGLLVAVLLLAGILLLVWLVVQQFRRNLAGTPVYDQSTPLTEPPFAGDEPATGDERMVARDIITSGPPKVSLQLKGSEPSVRTAVLPAGAITARGAVPGVNEPPFVPPNEKAGVVSEPVLVTAAASPVTPPPAREVPPPVREEIEKEAAPATEKRAPWRDREEISVPKPVATPSAPVPAWARAIRPPTPTPPVVPEPPAVEPSKPTVKAEPEPVAAAKTTDKEPATPEPVAAAKTADRQPATPVPIAAAAVTEEKAATPEPVAAAPVAPKETVAPPVEEPVVVAGKPPVEEPVLPVEEIAFRVEEPVGQGQPIPQLTTALSNEPVISELAQPEPESELVLIEPETTVAAPIAVRQPTQSSIESPSFASKIITTEPIRLQPTTSDIMPETTITPSPAFRPSSPTVSVQQPAGGMHTAVQLTFALEIASMQLTPTFKMSGLQLKPMSKVVSMRLAPSQ
ncbi:MAG: tetratricopeptide repeat protein, partial [Verrucomicrobiota bacterium]|nr:tetratricopeptide repeat protein [Verrucomicrobiota bacterium]